LIELSVFILEIVRDLSLTNNDLINRLNICNERINNAFRQHTKIINQVKSKLELQIKTNSKIGHMHKLNMSLTLLVLL
jgi:hypothetical protein